jgi:hypothetical protein
MDGTCSIHGKMRNAYKILAGKRDGKRPLEILWCSWKYTIRIDLGETVNWINLAEDRDQWWALADTIMTPRVP